MAIDINGTVLLNMRIFITIDAIYKNGSTVLCQCSDSNITAGVVNKGAVVTAQINPDTPPERRNIGCGISDRLLSLAADINGSFVYCRTGLDINADRGIKFITGIRGQRRRGSFFDGDVNCA